MRYLRISQLIIIVLLLVPLMALASCSGDTPEEGENGSAGTREERPDCEASQPPPSEEEQGPKDPREAVDLSLEPNEAGSIMVLMYHHIGEPEAEWVRTPENFRRDLETLYEKGYRPISLVDFVQGNITTEAGYTPVVLTFDDAPQNNFNVLEDGSIDPDCAFAILREFDEKYDDFPVTATFFPYGTNPFRQPEHLEWKLNKIIETGMDIGNHTADHRNLRGATAAEIQESIGAQAVFLEEKINDPSYTVNTLALPYGGRPEEEELKKYLRSGTYEGEEYENLAVLNVGWNPAPSPYADDFDPMSIPRIRASEMKVDNVGMYNYLEYYENNPEERFISDGNPDIITVPADFEHRLENYEGSREVYVYDPDEVK